ncbi:iron complex transport system substrate-binding protein [Isoptericola jiangsuensis]|uniref:Iron complex transport system substrate-binding protein n=1 Tax=Isoptericola jiangsuensis TaxID=548579 RepID=A0A2A9EZ81_9MICO|nr:iron-siderophore ABC transporter substrate-binding protein [Isoptericola jiangsuensis]PFG43622.1 iron complex transport system substrate-binding protein [Isoptericola jiangsuensis]
MRIRRTLAAAVGLAAAGTLTLTACASDSEPETADTATSEAPAAEGATDEFPVTITHAFGETVVESAPERVATWGWGSTEAALAVGVAPVGVAEQVWTVGPQTLLPWVEEGYAELGAEEPVIFTDAESGASIPYEEFVEADPDLILAPYSGITQEQYDVLSDIAPVVAYPEGSPWTTPWDETIRLSAQALGRSAAGEQVLADVDTYFADLAAEHPELEGKTYATIVDSPTEGLVYVYTPADPRVSILEGLGVVSAPSVDELDTSDGGFYYTLSYEELDKLEADFVVAYVYTQEEAETLADKAELQAIPAVAAGNVVQVVEPVAVSSVSPPTALSYDWKDGVPAIVDQLAALYGES